jgi:opacity protein-like surface antigen
MENPQDCLMFRIHKVPAPTHMMACLSCWVSLLGLVLLLGATGECGEAEPPPPSGESVPVAPGPLPPPQEQILAPIPRQFDWMRRDVRPNPSLESLLRLREVTPRLLMAISLVEEYSDNFFLQDRNAEEEYRTSLNLGTVYRLESGRSFVSLANLLRGSYDVRAGEGNFAFANLALNTGYELPRWSFSLSESFIRSDEPQDAAPTGIRHERRTFSQNIVSPQVRYSLTPTTALTGAYTNTLVWNDEAASDNADTLAGNQAGIEGDSVSHALSAGLQHWFRRNLSSSAGYTFTTIDRQDAADVQSHAVSGDLAYVISPRTTTLARVFGTLTDRGQETAEIRTDETDSRIFGVNFGVRRQITSALGAFASVGPTVVAREGRPTRVFANWQISLDGAIPLTQRTRLSLSTQQSIQDTAGDIDDVGLVLSQSAGLTLNHAISRDLLASVFATLAREQMLEDITTDVSTENRDFTYWSTGVSLSYALSRIWSLSATYRYQHRDSDVPDSSSADGTSLGGKYSENRVILSLTAAFPIF